MFIFFICSSQNVSGQLHSQDVISNGGVLIYNSNYKISGTVGQPLIGVISNSSYKTQQGFWSQLKARPTNIVLSTFTAQVSQDGILINWTTETEPNNAGFNVHRSQQDNDEYVKINESLIPSQGNATTGASYSYTDNPEQSGTYYFKLQSISLQGDSSFYGPVSATVTSVDIKNYTIPDEYTLSQNYPNPFNPTTMISFDIPKQTEAVLTILNIRGERVITVFDRDLSAGRHEVEFNANDLVSGLYFYRIECQGFLAVKKMLLVK